MKKIPIEISARHVHLSEADANDLFGKDFVFRSIRELSQREQFVADAHVTLKTSKGSLSARVLCPHRPHTQIELSKTDAIALGIEPSVAASGEFETALDVMASGPAGERTLRKCVILQKRHLHCSPTEAKELGLQDHDLVSVRVDGARAVTFHEVLVRVHPSYGLVLHLDTDEGNAAGVISGKSIGTLCKNENK